DGGSAEVHTSREHAFTSRTYACVSTLWSAPSESRDTHPYAAKHSRKARQVYCEGPLRRTPACVPTSTRLLRVRADRQLCSPEPLRPATPRWRVTVPTCCGSSGDVRSGRHPRRRSVNDVP